MWVCDFVLYLSRGHHIKRSSFVLMRFYCRSGSCISHHCLSAVTSIVQLNVCHLNTCILLPGRFPSHHLYTVSTPVIFAIRKYTEEYMEVADSISWCISLHEKMHYPAERSSNFHCLCERNLRVQLQQWVQTKHCGFVCGLHERGDWMIGPTFCWRECNLHISNCGARGQGFSASRPVNGYIGWVLHLSPAAACSARPPIGSSQVIKTQPLMASNATVYSGIFLLIGKLQPTAMGPLTRH